MNPALRPCFLPQPSRRFFVASLRTIGPGQGRPSGRGGEGGAYLAAARPVGEVSVAGQIVAFGAFSTSSSRRRGRRAAALLQQRVDAEPEALHEPAQADVEPIPAEVGSNRSSPQVKKPDPQNLPLQRLPRKHTRRSAFAQWCPSRETGAGFWWTRVLFG